MKPKRITAFLLSVAMTISLLPTFTLTASASETPTTTAEKNITLGTSALKGGQKSNVYFGNYQQSSLGNTQPTEGTEGIDWINSTTATKNSQGPYYSKDPIKWRVLSNDGSKLFLLSDKNLDVVRYHEDYEDVTWATSTIRSWLNGYGATLNTGGKSGKDYTSDNFIGFAFSENEKNAIATTKVINATYDGTSGTAPNPSYTSISGGIDTDDKVFLLSIAEAENTGCFADSDSRKAVNTAYVRGGGKTGTRDMRKDGNADLWWLRSPGEDARSVAYVLNHGGVESYGFSVTSSSDAVRPAFNLNPASVLFTSAAKGGKKVDVGAISKNVDLSALSGNDNYKLTLTREYADGEEFSAEQKETSTQKGGTLKFEYSNAKTVENEYVSAMITDKDGKEVLYYGQLAKVTQANGTAELKIPTALAFGEYKVKLFNEQINGDYKTDLASDFIDFALNVDTIAGGGTETDPYLIYNLSDLEYFRDKVNSGNDYSYKYVKVMADIDMSEKYGEKKSENGEDVSWEPIGDDSHPFYGTFDGNEKLISNLYIIGTSSNRGLFGHNEGTIKKLSVSGKVRGTDLIGGIVGKNKGNIEMCINYCSVEAVNMAGKAGGIAGMNYTANTAIITNCYNAGDVKVTGVAAYVGGVTGFNYGEIANCYSYGWAEGTQGSANVGGVAGMNYTANTAIITNCYYHAGRASGGICGSDVEGRAEGKTEEQFKSGEVAWLLQNGQTAPAEGEPIPQVWGQTLTGNNKDSYPVLSSEEEKSVKKVSFKVKDSENEGQYKDYAVKYVNDGKALGTDFPADPDDKCEYWWSETANVNDTKFTKDTVITKDMTVYGVKKEITEASDKSDEITLNKNTEITPINLSDYVQNKSGNGKNFAFELVDGQTLPDGLEFDESTGKITGKPTKVGTYTVKFNVANNGISLMSLESVNNVDVLTLTFNVDLEKDKTVLTTTYLIYNLDDLEYFRDKVNGGKNYKNECVKLADKLDGDVDYIDMSAKYNETTGKSWDPIGKSSTNNFEGTFDGNGKEIQNIYIDDEEAHINSALFACTGGSSVIKNLGVTGSITGAEQIGGIIGENNGTIENCYYTGMVSGYNDVGGIAGRNIGTIKNCYSVANVSGNENVGGITANDVLESGVDNCYYLDGCIKNGSDSKIGTAKTEAEFNSGEVAYLLQNGQTSQFWGQKLNETDSTKNDKYPILTSEADKKVYKVAQMTNTPTGGDYTENSAVYGNDEQTLTLNGYKGTYTNKFYGWTAEKSSRTLIDKYTINKSDAEVYSVWNELTFDVSGEKQTYQTGTARKITLTPKINGKANENVKSSAFDVKYYEVNENTGKLRTTEAVNAISAGKYLYVISFAENANGTTAQEYCNFKNAYTVGTSTDLPNIENYDNIGYMLITSGAETAQKPIYFKEGTINLKVGGTFENELTNENGTTPDIKSSNESVATATFADGKVTVTAIGKGTATITATSVRENSTPVYASFTVNVGLATKTLTADNFNVVAKSKTYDETDSVTLTATLKNGVAYEGDNLKFDITGKFENANAGEDKKVSYEITGITGTGAENYVLDGGKISISAENSTVTANIAKAQVTIICSETTTRTYDGNAQTVDVSAMANGKVFDKSNYTILYDNKAAVNTENEKYPSAVKSYPVTIKLNDNVKQNYEVTQPSATLVIKSATQDVFSIEDIPEIVYYGDSFTVDTYGENANATVTYEISTGTEIASIDKNTGKVTVNGVGKVTIKATSTLDGHNPRYATRTFEAKKRILTPTATAVNRTYNGENTVDVSITLDNTVNSDEIGTNTTTGTMANADAGNGKIVYVSGIELTGDKKDYYTLSATSLQTTVDIEKAEITGFTVSADDKKYDGTANATATVETISGVIEADKGQVEIVGSAKFNNKDSADDKTVTFTATGLSGAKAQNYVLGNNAKTATDTAKIEPLKVDFVIGQKTFVYDGKDKKISVSASDENGKIFKDYSISYTKGGKSATPNEVGTYTATITLGDTTNYYTGQGDVTVTISEATQDSLVIVGLPGTIQYGDSFDLEAVGGAESDNESDNESDISYTWSCEQDGINIANGDTAKPTVTVNDGAVGEKVEISVTKTVDNYEPITAKVVFVPTAKTVTFDISNLEQTYGAVTDVTVNPNETGATYDVTYNGNDTLPTNAGTYTVKVTATGNYTGAQTATLTIKKATATGTITGVENSYTYGNTVDKTQINATSTMGSVTPKITFAGTGIYVPQEAAPTKVGNYTVIAEFTDSNYETLTVTKDFVIEKATLTVKADNAKREYGEANPIFTLSYTGFENGETKDVLLSEPIATVNANASSPVTDDNTKYYITVSGGNAENYKFVYDNTGELTIEPTGNGTLYITGSSNTVRVDDVFMLYAFYGNSKVNVTWSLKDGSPTDVIELDPATGKVTAIKHGTVTIIATIADKNYSGKPAEFTLNVKQTGITLVPTGLVKTYTGERQDISFANNADFTPEIGKNVTVEYTLISDPTVKEPVQVGTYSVVYTINDGSYTGGGNTTMYINKATVTVNADKIEKEYGEKTEYKLIVSDNVKGINAETMKEFVTITSNGAPETAAVGEYDINVELTKTSDENCNYVVNTEANGKLKVTPAKLTVNVADITREHGAENPTELTYTIDGFKNGETADILTGSIAPVYAETIKEEVGTQKDVVTAASTLENGNYTVEIKYVDGEGADLTITKIAVNASAGTSRASYLTVNFDKAVEGLTADDFTVKNGEESVEITGVTASSDNKTYTLNGTFTVGTEYTVEITYDNATQDISNKTLKITPTKQSSGGGGGGGGSSATTSYTVTFDTNGGSKVDSVKVEKNKTVSEPTAPTKDGFEFDGWYSDKKLTTAYDFDTKVTKAITLYAKWTEKKVDDKKDDNKDDDNNPTPSEWKNPFTDVTSDYWFFDNVKYANQNGLMSGTTATTFAPNETLTRGMLVTVLYRADGEPAVNKSIPFGDVTADSYYRDAVIWAQQNGIIKGISETEFAPDENITREQIATIIYRYAEYKGIAPTGAWAIKLDYADVADISDYAVEGVMYCTMKNIMQGKDNNMFAPKDNATRAEIAAILNRFIEGNK